MIEMKGGLEGRWEYNADIFDLVTIERQVGHFQRLLQGMVADSHCRVSALPLIHEAEYRMLIHAPHQPVTEASDATRVTELIESWGVQTSDAIAVAFEHELLTYHELNRRANRFAHLLRQVGVGPNVLVGLCVERSLEMAVGLLAILKAGGAYVPLDPAYPAERLAFMLADSGISVILTQHRFEPELRTAGTRLIALD
ncbi:non-ribosomal peptide synthetase, partial [Candidatus Entotheonella serta]